VADKLTLVVTVKEVDALVALAAPNTITTTLPVPVAADGTVTVILVGPQLVAVAVNPLTVTVPDTSACDVPKFVPVMVIGVPTGPEFPLSDWMVGGEASTDKKATAVPPVPPSLEVTLPVVLVIGPTAVPVTLTLKVHDPLAASVPPDRVTEFESAP